LANAPGFNDPAFASNKSLPLHRWVPWIAGFSRDFVQSALERHMKQPGLVLDPFAGVGTTLVEANLAGHDVAGFEINPYAAFACRIKTQAYRIEPSALEKATLEFLSFHEDASRNDRKPKAQPPEGFRTRTAFYSPKVLRKVLLTLDFIEQLNDKSASDAFRLAFASTMVTYSNYSYEPSLSRKVSAGRPEVEDHAVDQAIAGKLYEMASDIDWVRARMKGCKPSSIVVNESFFDSFRQIKSGSVDLLITSPPYLNNYHYNRNTRPHLYWLGLASSPKDFKELEYRNFGKFWQTVRENERIDLDFPIADEEIRRTLGVLRRKNPENGVYGGRGWANYAASYFNDCYRFSKAARFVLRRRGTALVVIGNSILQGVMIPTDRYLARIAESVGLEVVDIHIPRASRVGSSIIHSEVRAEKAKKGGQLYEAVVELRKR